MKKLILITTFLTGYSLGSLAHDIPNIPDIPDFDICSIQCFSEDSEGNKYKGVHTDISKIIAQCSEIKALNFSLVKCQKRSETPASCAFIADSCE